MDNLKNSIYYIQKIKGNLVFIVVHMLDVDLEELNANEILLDSMLFRIIIKNIQYTKKEAEALFLVRQPLFLFIDSPNLNPADFQFRASDIRPKLQNILSFLKVKRKIQMLIIFCSI